MKMSAYTSKMPGLMMNTPMTQFGLNNSPNMAGLGANVVDGTPQGFLQKVEQVVSDNPLPVLLLIGFLVLR